MRPAEVCGCCTYPSSSRCARMLRTVADDTPSPAAVTGGEDATGSPDSMYRCTSADKTRPERSLASIGTLSPRLLTHYTTGGQVAGGGPGFGHNLGAVHADRQEVGHEHLAVHDGRTDVAAARRIDERRGWVGPRCHVELIAIDDDEVRPLADLDRSQFVLEAERARAR